MHKNVLGELCINYGCDISLALSQWKTQIINKLT